MNQGMQAPVINRVDWFIAGGCSAGVTAALALARSGRSVMLAAPRSYVGEDIAGTFRFWDRADADHDVPLAVKLFASSEPPTPMRVKLLLEEALLNAGVQLLLTTSPAGVVCNAAGHSCGVVIANRAGRQVVLAGGLIDASVDGSLSRIAGHDVFRPSGVHEVTHVTLCHDHGTDADGINVEHLPGYRGSIGDTQYELSARRYRLAVDFGDGSPDAFVRAQAEVTRRCWVPQQYLHQEQIEFADSMDGHDTESANTPIDRFELEPGLFTLSPYGATPPSITHAMRRPVVSLDVGHRLGMACALKEQLPPAQVAGLRVRCADQRPIEQGEIRTLAYALRSSAVTDEHLWLDDHEIPRLAKYDVIVLGGGTAGAPAAIAAAQAGASVGLIENGPALGGVGTLGQITQYWFGNRVGFTETIDEGVRRMEFREYYKNAKARWSVSAKQAWYHQRCHELGVAVWLSAQGVGVWVEGDRVRGVVVAGPQGYGLIEANAVVDSTGCADLPAAAGASTVTIGAEHAAVQGTGLAGLAPSCEYNNSDHNFCDDTDVADATTFFASSRRKFAGHFDIGQLVDSRERRQIVGQYTLDPVDLLFDRRFPDTICVARSNFDSHGYTIHPVFMLKAPDKSPLWADVPFRCLVPKGLRGVLVTGLAVSAHRDALPVIRMQADVQNQGYAAGYAAAMACRDGVDVTQIDVRELQKHLVEIGSLPKRVLTDKDSFPVDQATLEHAVREGLDEPAGLALMLSDPQRSRPMLRAAFDEQTDRDVCNRCALILAYMDDAYGESALRDHLSEQAWDQGWNYTGMGQFGESLSEIDVMVIALGRVGGHDAWPVLLDLTDQLRERAEQRGELPEFSHCRALAIAFESLMSRHGHHDAAAALDQFLSLPGASGHAHTTHAHAVAALTDDPNETQVRNRSLRELYLARAIYRCGDHNDVGRRTLEAYARDLRGHFARHARANLDRLSISSAQSTDSIPVAVVS